MGEKNYREYQVVLEVKKNHLIRKKQPKIFKKLFSGCYNCKRRKIKCDETKPQCMNCRRGTSLCSWPSDASVTLRHPCEPGTASNPLGFSFTPSRSALSPTIQYARMSHGRKGSRSLEVPLEEENFESEKEVALGNSHLNASSQDTEPQPQLQLQSQLQLQPQRQVVPRPQPQSFESDFNCMDFVQGPWSPLGTAGDQIAIDSFCLDQFAKNFLPTVAQVYSHDKTQLLKLVLTTSENSGLLQEIFIACGASFYASVNPASRPMAHDRYTRAIGHFVSELKLKHIRGEESWFFVAVQILQILCLRDTFAGSNATRCAAHFGAAYKLITRRILGHGDPNFEKRPVLALEKFMLENYIFNYSITIFFCDHLQLKTLMPNPYYFFCISHKELLDLFGGPGLAEYRYNSILAFLLAAKCSWLCRLKLPLNRVDKLLCTELLVLAQSILAFFDKPQPPSLPLNIRITIDIAKVVLYTCIILLKKMLDPENIRAADLQSFVMAIKAETEHPHNQNAIFPIWSLMVAASCSLSVPLRQFFRSALVRLLKIAKSELVYRILVYLDGLWELYGLSDRAFEMVFDTNVLDQICN